MNKSFHEHAADGSISLQRLLNELVTGLPDPVDRNRIIVENDVPSEFRMKADKDLVLPVISELLSTVVANARNTCISITAEKFSDIVILHIEDRNNYNGYALSFSLMAVSQQARYIGGDISIQGAQQRVATVSFSFPDTPSGRRPVFCGAIA